jgi:ribonuclease HII
LAEEAFFVAGHALVAGCDEAGRGPLAGPVIAAAVILPRGWMCAGLTDSKQIDAATRERLDVAVRAAAVAVGVGRAEAAEIDALNILRASLLAMHRAVEALGVTVDALLVDGKFTVPGLACAQAALVKGDSRSVSIAAASIVAKVARDAELVALDALHPGYGFAQHKGYPSPLHLEALQRLGPCPAHRRTFGPVRVLLEAPPPLPPSRSRGASAAQLSLFGDGDGGP